MNDFIVSRYNHILDKLDTIEALAFRLARIAACFAIVAALLTPASAAYAGRSTGDDTDDAAMTFIDIFNDLGQLASS